MRRFVNIICPLLSPFFLIILLILLFPSPLPFPFLSQYTYLLYPLRLHKPYFLFPHPSLNPIPYSFASLAFLITINISITSSSLHSSFSIHLNSTFTHKVLFNQHQHALIQCITCACNSNMSGLRTAIDDFVKFSNTPLEYNLTVCTLR